jgi:O-antigen/teichoic acid export membrane protein
MVTVPVSAMYTAKQYIAELTIYSFVTTTINAGILYYMLMHPGVWLVKYAFCTCCLSVVPQLIITLRGWWIFDECRFRLRYCISKERFRDLAYFVGWWSFGSFGGLLRRQGIQILVNKYFGPLVNASMTVANSVNCHTITLSGAMLGAFQPAIVSACGAGDESRMRALAYRACKFSMLFLLVFMLPLSLELREILRIWLVNPPRCVYGLCLIIFATTLIDQSAVGHMLAVNAKGKIAMYQMVLGTSLLLSLPLAWLFCELGYSVYAVAVALFLTMAFCALGRVWFARTLAGMSARYWAFSIMLPIVIVTLCATFFGLLPRFFMVESFIRIIVTTIFCEVAFIPLVWFVLFDNCEREFVLGRIPWLRKS